MAVAGVSTNEPATMTDMKGSPNRRKGRFAIIARYREASELLAGLALRNFLEGKAAIFGSGFCARLGLKCWGFRGEDSIDQRATEGVLRLRGEGWLGFVFVFWSRGLSFALLVQADM